MLSHSIIVAGYAVILLMSRTGADPDTPPAGRRGTSQRWRATFDTEPPAVPRLRLVSGPARPAETALTRGVDRRAA